MPRRSIHAWQAASRSSGLTSGLRARTSPQAVDLVAVEDRVHAPHGDDGLDLLAGRRVALALLRGLGEDDVGGALALAHLRADGLRLAVGHPERRGVAGVDGGAPEDEHVDALVGHGVLAQRLGDAGVRIDGPRPVPGQHAFRHLRDDLAGDAFVEFVDAGHLPVLLRFERTAPRRAAGVSPAAARPDAGPQGRRPPAGLGLAADGPAAKARLRRSVRRRTVVSSGCWRPRCGVRDVLGGRVAAQEASPGRRACFVHLVENATILSA